MPWPLALYFIEQNHKMMMETKKVYVVVTSAAFTYYNFVLKTEYRFHLIFNFHHKTWFRNFDISLKAPLL